MIVTFLDSYRAAVAGCSSIPTDDATFRRLLDLFLLEKALYEICYEAANRPDWITIPVYGVLRILSQRHF
jgi:maltose alpha-D-glucosyltransferase/alpha-amylase